MKMNMQSCIQQKGGVLPDGLGLNWCSNNQLKPPPPIPDQAFQCVSRVGLEIFIFYSICFVYAIKREVRFWDPGHLTKRTMKTLWRDQNLLTADGKRRRGQGHPRRAGHMRPFLPCKEISTRAKNSGAKEAPCTLSLAPHLSPQVTKEVQN